MKKLIVLVMLMSFMFGLDVEGEFRGNKFGISPDKIVETNEVWNIYEGDMTVWHTYIVDLGGYEAYASYGFYNNKLYFGGYSVYGEGMTHFAESLVASYTITKQKDGSYEAYSKDKKTILIASDEIDSNGTAYVEVRLFDLATNKVILELEQKAKVRKL
jgi:hypothetical protein